jgi:hypothetical protein
MTYHASALGGPVLENTSPHDPRFDVDPALEQQASEIAETSRKSTYTS